MPNDDHSHVENEKDNNELVVKKRASEIAIFEEAATTPKNMLIQTSKKAASL